MSNVAGIHRGFTLIEMLMTIAILAVLSCLALPAYGKLTAKTRAQTARNDLNTTLNFARLAAVAKHAHVIACPSDNQSTCVRTTHWQQGWLVFADSNHDGARQDSEAILSVNQAQAPGIAIVGTLGRMRVDYQPDGTASGTNITLTVCDRGAEAGDATSLIINNAGRLRSEAADPDHATTCMQAAG